MIHYSTIILTVVIAALLWINYDTFFRPHHDMFHSFGALIVVMIDLLAIAIIGGIYWW